MSDQTVLMTEVGFRKVRDELDQLLNVTRPTIITYLQDARDGIDAADNTEYLYLQEELIFVERRIRELQFSLENARSSNR
jgi:transcription elongation GreA/GreB family factor